MLDIRAIRAQFPALLSGTAHFDGPGGSQVPSVVADAVARTLTSSISNRGRNTASERLADDTVLEARSAVADLLGADPGGVVFGRSMTQLTYDFARTLARTWAPGDEVVVTRLDHDANIRPWVQAADTVGATVRWADFDPDSGELAVADVSSLLTARTRLVAVTGASNLIGTRPDLAALSAAVRSVGALFFVDGVHLSPHAPVDVAGFGADFYVCSPYKFFGPHCGVLAAAPRLLESLHPDKLLPSAGRVPERFELGTLPYELLAGTTAAVDFVAGLDPAATGSRRDRLWASLAAVDAYETSLADGLRAQLAALPGVRLYGHAPVRTPTLLFCVAGRSSARVTAHLAGLGVNAPSGSFYAVEASRRLGLGDGGAVRVGLAPYVDGSDVRRLVDGVGGFCRS